MRELNPRPLNAVIAPLPFLALGPPIGAIVFILASPEVSPPHLFILVFVFSYLVAFKTVLVAGVLFAVSCAILAGLCKRGAVPLFKAAIVAAASGGAAIYLVPIGSGTFPAFGSLLLASVSASLCIGLLSARFFPIGYGSGLRG